MKKQYPKARKSSMQRIKNLRDRNKQQKDQGYKKDTCKKGITGDKMRF